MGTGNSLFGLTRIITRTELESATGVSLGVLTPSINNLLKLNVKIQY